jgi:hypothetical protein
VTGGKDRYGTQIGDHATTALRFVAVFEQVDALPAAEREPAVANGNRERNRGECTLDVGRHVVGALRSVRNPLHRRLIRCGHEPAKELDEIAAHVGVGVLLDQQRARRVLHEQR